MENIYKEIREICGSNSRLAKENDLRGAGVWLPRIYFHHVDRHSNAMHSFRDDQTIMHFFRYRMQPLTPAMQVLQVSDQQCLVEKMYASRYNNFDC